MQYSIQKSKTKTKQFEKEPLDINQEIERIESELESLKYRKSVLLQELMELEQ